MLYLTGIDDREHLADQKAFWGRKRYGLDFTAALGSVVRYPRLDTILRKSALITDAVEVLALDMYKAGPEVGAGRCFGRVSAASD